MDKKVGGMKRIFFRLFSIVNLKERRGVAGIGKAFGLFECACFIIVRPFSLAFERGMIIQAFVPQWGSAAGGPCEQMWYPGEKWTDYTRL
jgi:hypothetical protein